MNRRWLYFLVLVMVLAVITGVHSAFAGPGTMAVEAVPTPSGGTFFANSPAGPWVYTNATGSVYPTPSNSGTPLRKFIDALPVLCSTATNSLGQCLPVAQADTTTYGG